MSGQDTQATLDDATRSQQTAQSRDMLAALEHRWELYRRDLRRDNQIRFERVFEYARRHVDDPTDLSSTDKAAQLVFLSVALEQERRIDELEARIETVADDPLGEPDNDSGTPRSTSPEWSDFM